MGVDQFAVYLMHDQIDQTLEAYGHQIIPPLSKPKAIWCGFRTILHADSGQTARAWLIIDRTTSGCSLSIR